MCASVYIDYRRAVTSMAIIGLCVAVAANVFTIYSVRLPRYVLRRLAACLQLGAGQTITPTPIFITFSLLLIFASLKCWGKSLATRNLS